MKLDIRKLCAPGKMTSTAFLMRNIRYSSVRQIEKEKLQKGPN